MRKITQSRRVPVAVTLVSVPCPIHGVDLKVTYKDGRVYAVCKCKVPNNQFLNQVVWERDDTRRIL